MAVMAVESGGRPGVYGARTWAGPFESDRTSELHVRWRPYFEGYAKPVFEAGDITALAPAG